MNNTKIFDALLLLARPGAGKSEIIRHLKNTPLEARQQRFHVGNLVEIDDFPMLWAWFEEDDLLQQMGKPRLHSTPDGYFYWEHLWHVLIRRIGLEYRKAQRDWKPENTALIEFSRGKEHGGFAAAFEHLDPALLKNAAILYVNVSYEESLRKNRRRFNPDRPDSILEHGLSDEKLERLYRESDWAEVTSADPEWVSIQGVRVPYVVFENEDDVTTPGGEPLSTRLEDSLNRLWMLRQQNG